MTAADRQTTIRLPSAVYEKLAAAADTSGSSVGEEIRRRLVASFGPRHDYGQPDQKTREVLIAIEEMASALADQFPPWHVDEGSYRAFFGAVIRWLKDYEPGGDPTMKPKPDGLFRSGGATIKAVGAMLLGAASSALSFLARFEAEEEER
jgi:hypothetical protein